MCRIDFAWPPPDHYMGARAVRHDGGVLQLDMPVAPTLEALPDNPTGRAFREVARMRATSQA